MTFIIITILVFILLLLVYIILALTYYIVVFCRKHRLTLKETLSVVNDYFRRKSEVRCLLAYIAAMASLVGPFFFSEAELFFAHQTNDDHTIIKVSANDATPNWLVFIIAILISLAYFLFCFKRMYSIIPPGTRRAVDLINMTYDIPTWNKFDEFSRKTIEVLGNKYDKTKNYPYEKMDILLASLRRDSSIKDIVADKLKELKREIYRLQEKYNGLSCNHIDNYRKYFTIFIEAFSGDSFTYKEYEAITISINLFNRDLIEDQKANVKENTYYSGLSIAFNKFKDVIDSIWLKGLKHNTVIVNGRGGIGKSHLLADIVSKRLNAGEPTLFFLGKSFTDSSEPLDQILSKLDIKSKKDLFLTELNRYHQRPVIVIDGLNEGVGKSYWENHLQEFITTISKYSNIGLIVSYRSTDNNNWFDRYSEVDGHVLYHHKGFEGSFAAIEFMFKSYGLPMPSFPFYSSEFENPMFLTFYCRSHELSKKPLKYEGRKDIVDSYIWEINTNLSVKLCYNSRLNLVDKALSAFANILILQNNSWIAIDDALKTINLAARECYKSKEFFDALTDEGILQVNTKYDDSKYYVSFNYETIGDIYIARELVKKYSITEWYSNDALYDKQYIEYLSPIKEEKEAFEYVEDLEVKQKLIDRFIAIYPWRNTSTTEGDKIIQNIIATCDYDNIIALSIACSSNNSKIINSDTLTDLLMPLSNVEIDKFWTINISGYSSTELMRIASWGWGMSQNAIDGFDDLTLRRFSEILVWSLSSTNIQLRDVSTKALINLLRFRLSVLSDIIKRFNGVHDMYILDRLWAVVFGCCVNNNNKNEVQCIARLTYNLIFNQPVVIEHILIRDYAKNIIQYAESIGCEISREMDLFNKPFNADVVLPYMPSNEYIRGRYEERFDAVSEELRGEWAVKRSITDSMITEYSKRGMYGDFGRYVFQNCLSVWPEDPESLSNWAIDYIFKQLKYDATAFVNFDKRNPMNDRSRNRIERIGKKYQWIAMYHIMAILSDLHFGEPKLDDWNSVGIVKARNIDPTIISQPGTQKTTKGNLIYSVPEYDLNNKNASDNKWLKDYKDMPTIKSLIVINDTNGIEWINLYSYNTIKDKLLSDISNDNLSERELWIFVQSMFVNNANRKEIISLIHKEGLEGRSGMENSESYSVFYREFYWSDLYKSEIKDMGYFDRPYYIGSTETHYNVQPTYLSYTKESYSDQSLDASKNIIMPSDNLFNGLNMHFGEGEGVWKNSEDELICVDNSIYENGKPALLVRKDALLSYLKDVDKVIVWPILMERTLNSIGGGIYNPREQAGGYAWMGGNGKIYYKFRSYTPSIKNKWKNALYKYFKRVSRNFDYQKNMLLHKLYLKRLSDEQISVLHLNILDQEDWINQLDLEMVEVDKDIDLDGISSDDIPFSDNEDVTIDTVDNDNESL